MATHKPHERLFLTGMKTTVSEAEHPLLCEGTRREKGDLALALMIDHAYKVSKGYLAHGRWLINVRPPFLLLPVLFSFYAAGLAEKKF